MRDDLPRKSRPSKCLNMVNFDKDNSPSTHWVAYAKRGSTAKYSDNIAESEHRENSSIVSGITRESRTTVHNVKFQWELMWTIVGKISSWISDINLNYTRNVSHFSPDIHDSTTTNMSFTSALTGRSNVLSAKYFPLIDLTDGEYELGLVYFETCSTIPNVERSNDKFYFRDKDDEIAVQFVGRFARIRSGK